MLRAILFISCLCGLAALAQDNSGGSLTVPRVLEGTEIVDKRGTQLPLDAWFTDHHGKRVSLNEIFAQDASSPVILALGYYGCPMLCGMVFGGLSEGVRGLDLKLGKDYRIVTLSIDPTESSELAAAKRQNYLSALGLSSDAPWYFLTGTKEQVDRVAEAVGFGYRYDAPSKEYAHSAGVFILTPTGVVSRTYWGIQYDPKELRLSLIDASGGKVGTLMDRILLSCFHYDPDSHRYGVYIFGVMRLGGALTAIVVGSMLLAFWYSERRKRGATA